MSDLAKYVADSIRRDGVDLEQFSEPDRINIVLAYAAAEVKKFDSFVGIYLTTPEARKSLIQFCAS